MNLEELMAEIGTVVRDDSLAEKYPGWINNAISELAADYDLPALRLIEPVPLEVTENTWIYDVPASYQKRLFRARNGGYGRVQITRYLDDLHRKDIAHTQVGEKVTSVGVRDRKIGVFPKANDTLYLWFYEKPTPLKAPEDRVTCIPEEYQARVIIPKMVVKNFTLLQDLVIDAPHQSIAFWQAELRAGLNGRPQDQIGLLTYLALERGVRRHGGRDPLP